MSHSHTPQPEKHEGGPTKHAPQVAVRDGNRLLCPCCGEVLMVIQETPSESSDGSDDRPAGYRADCLVEPIDPEVAAYEFPDEDPPKIPERRGLSMSEPVPRKREPRPRRSKGRIGAPLTYEMARFYAWVYYRMKKLNIQLIGEITKKQEEIDALERTIELLDEVASRKEPGREEHSPEGTPERQERVPQTHEEHAQADVATAPANTHERGPP